MRDLVTNEELKNVKKWVEESFSAQSVGTEEHRFPLSFRYAAQESDSILKDWERRRESGPAGEGTEAATIILTDTDTGLECRCEVTTFANFPAVEWVATLKNTAKADTPIIENIQSLDCLFPVEISRLCWLHHAKGDEAAGGGDYAPLKTQLHRQPSVVRLENTGGRSSFGTLPYFNVEMDGAGGVIGAIGWSGSWVADFHRDKTGIRIKAGMKETHLTLRPGEEIRTFRILLLFWKEDRIRGHNVFRRLILDHHTPPQLGYPIDVPVSELGWGELGTEGHLERIRWAQENKIPISQYWIDAGWFGDGEFDFTNEMITLHWAQRAGSWYPNKQGYPDGMKPIGDLLREIGMGFVLWFEPERVVAGTELHRQHPEWLLGPTFEHAELGDCFLLDFGNPEARRFITDRVSDLITEGGLTCYRQDANWLEPAVMCRANDEPNRIGMHEIRFVEGLYAFYDELLARHPGLYIDNCATGGKRLDLEMVSRSINLWRSDMQTDHEYDPIIAQTQTQGLALWTPVSTALCPSEDRYVLRSTLGPGIMVQWCRLMLDRKENIAMELIHELMREVHEVRKYFLGDFYPLISFSLADDTWAASQYDRPDLGGGIVLAFRRRRSPGPSMTVVLMGLDPKADYEMRSRDGGDTFTATGKALLSDGFSIEIEDKPGSALFEYKRLD